MDRNYTLADGHDFLEKLERVKGKLKQEDDNHYKKCVEKIHKGMAMVENKEERAETFFQSAMSFTENFFNKHKLM